MQHVGEIFYANCGTTLLPCVSHSMKHYASGVWFAESLKATVATGEFFKVWNQDREKAGKTGEVTKDEVKNLTDPGWL